jgi:glucose-6-phosphate 1-dehydrogenase
MGDQYSAMASGGFRVRDPFTLTIFGATGDLTHRKLMPALFSLFRQGLLPDRFAVVGFARRDYTDETFRTWMGESIRKFAATPPQPGEIEAFLPHVFYHLGDVEADPRTFAALKGRLDSDPRLPRNHLFYLSVKAELFEVIIRHLSEYGMVHGPFDPLWTRVVIEKPFGRDLESALALNRACLNYLNESQIYRIDHYLGKETVQNILSFRFANAIFEPIFNHRYVDHIQITAAETVGMESGRGAFYDETGALRDMVQNHLMQLLCLVTMEPPSRMTADAIRNEKVKVLQSVVPVAPGCVDGMAVRGQYAAGEVDGKPLPGYRQEERIQPESTTPTFVAMRVDIENWRWKGVPIYLRTGKRLRRRVTEIMIQFKIPPLQLFQTVECVGDMCDLTHAKPNRLIFRIQPSEGIALRFSAKRPALQVLVEDVVMDFLYSDKWPGALPEAYERLLLDAIRGDSTLFTRSDEVEAQWRVVQPVLRAWEGQDECAPVTLYPSGSWGPPEAASIFANYDTDWHNPEA